MSLYQSFLAQDMPVRMALVAFGILTIATLVVIAMVVKETKKMYE